MKKKPFLYCILGILIATGCSTPTSYLRAAGSPSPAEGSFDKTLNVSGMIDLDVSTGSGSIVIRQGTGGRVEIHGQVRASNNGFQSDRDAENAVRRIESSPPIEQSGQSIRIGRIPDRETEQHVSVSYEIVTPAQSNVVAHSGSGSLSIEGMSGRVNAGTGSGGITLRNINGDLQANTGSGSIHATGLRGGLRMTTGSGAIQAEGEQTAPWELQTGSGGIDIHLPKTASFDLAAHTGSGNVTVDFPLTISGRIDANRRSVGGKVGTGQYPLSARTGSGHIRIE
jgi:Putative adhesin